MDLQGNTFHFFPSWNMREYVSLVPKSFLLHLYENTTLFIAWEVYWLTVGSNLKTFSETASLFPNEWFPRTRGGKWWRDCWSETMGIVVLGAPQEIHQSWDPLPLCWLTKESSLGEGAVTDCWRCDMGGAKGTNRKYLPMTWQRAVSLHHRNDLMMVSKKDKGYLWTLAHS